MQDTEFLDSLARADSILIRIFFYGKDQNRLHRGLCLASAGPANSNNLAPLDFETLHNNSNIDCKCAIVPEKIKLALGAQGS